jgi:hypothetical protein
MKGVVGMALILQLRPDLEETLAAQAKAAGLSVQDYVQSILEQRLATEAPEQELTLEEFEAALDGLAEYSDKIPDLPLEAFSRRGIYRDHD